ncbi:MAG: hypothetical protein ACI9V1_000386 [Spirosomataceae bacterium]|jgi:hypothetical protein
MIATHFRIVHILTTLKIYIVISGGVDCYQPTGVELDARI